MSNKKNILTDRHILITRPKDQCQSLAERIESLGGNAILFPTIEIKAPDNVDLLKQHIQQLDQFDIVIFVSVNAVTWSSQLIKQAWPKLPKKLQIAAIGSTTKSQIENQGWPVALCPAQHFNSESLLALPELQQVARKNILIISGQGGRQLLYNTLTERGSAVKKACAYQRVCPNADIQALLSHWKNDEIDIVLSTSGESLQNLFSLLGNKGIDYLQRTPLLVISTRMAENAQNLGYRSTPLIAKNASENAIIDALLAWSMGEAI